MSREIFSHEVASPQKDRARKGLFNMEKMRKVNETLQLLEIARHNLRDLAEACENERRLIFRALDVADAEQVEDAKLYRIVNDLEYNAKDLADKAEEIEGFIKDLERVKL